MRKKQFPWTCKTRKLTLMLWTFPGKVAMVCLFVFFFLLLDLKSYWGTEYRKKMFSSATMPPEEGFGLFSCTFYSIWSNYITGRKQIPSLVISSGDPVGFSSCGCFGGKSKIPVGGSAQVGANWLSEPKSVIWEAQFSISLNLWEHNRCVCSSNSPVLPTKNFDHGFRGRKYKA